MKPTNPEKFIFRKTLGMSLEYVLPSKNKNWSTITKFLSEFDSKNPKDLIVQSPFN
jgi:hypothetical protein